MNKADLIARVRELLAWRVKRAWEMCPEDVEFETLVPQLCDALEEYIFRFRVSEYRESCLRKWEKEIRETGDNVGEEFVEAVQMLRAAHEAFRNVR